MDGMLTREQIESGITEVPSTSVCSSAVQEGRRIGHIRRPNKGTTLLRLLNNV